MEDVSAKVQEAAKPEGSGGVARPGKQANKSSRERCLR